MKTKKLVGLSMLRIRRLQIISDAARMDNSLLFYLKKKKKETEKNGRYKKNMKTREEKKGNERKRNEDEVKLNILYTVDPISLETTRGNDPVHNVHGRVVLFNLIRGKVVDLARISRLNNKYKKLVLHGRQISPRDRVILSSAPD